MPEPRNHLGGYVDGTLACVAGTREPTTNGTVDCLDTTTRTWRAPMPMPTPTSGAAAAIFDGTTVVAGGEPSSETSLFPEIQILHGGSWSDQPMLVPRHGTGYAVFENRLWMCGGATAPVFHPTSACTSLAL